MHMHALSAHGGLQWCCYQCQDYLKHDLTLHLFLVDKSLVVVVAVLHTTYRPAKMHYYALEGPGISSS